MKIKWLTFLIGWFCSVGAMAVDVYNIDQLSNALNGRAIKSGNKLILQGDVYLQSGIVIKDGGHIILDLNNYTIFYDRSREYIDGSGHDIAFNINGYNASLIIQNGSIVTKAANGADSSKSNWEADKGSNASCVVLNRGAVSLVQVVCKAIGGKGGYQLWVGNKPDGEPWVIDANGNYNLGNMLPNGTYFSVPEGFSDYTSIDGGIKQQDATVALTKYQITYNPNGGVMASSTANYTVLNVDNFQLPGEGAISKKGYTFKGWNDNGRMVDHAYLKEKINTSGRVASVQMNFMAQWEAIRYRVNYYSDGYPVNPGALNPTTYTVEYGNRQFYPIQRPDADFIGWRDRETGQLISHLPVDNPRNLILDAVWDKKYTITFETGTDQQIRPLQTRTSQVVLLPVPLKRDGYLFDGWSDGVRVLKNEIPANKYESDVVLTAQWRPLYYSIYFKDGSTVHKRNQYTIETGWADFSPMEKDGYVFEAWVDEQGQPATSVSKGSFGDKTFYAKWIEVSYSLTYEYRDNKTPDKTISYLYTEAASHSLESTSWMGYNFLGWYLNGVKLEAMPTPSDGKQTNYVLTTQAKWELKRYKVSFFLNDGTGAQLSENKYTYTVEKGIPASDMPKDPVRTGYTFKGWFDNEQGTGTVWNEVPAGTIDLSLYAQWEPNSYQITYHWQGGEEVINAPKSFKYNEETLLPDKKVMKKAHHTFVGWTKDNSSATYVSSIPANTEGDQAFYAQWSPKVYQIQYHVNGGSVVGEQSYLYGTEIKVRESNKTGYALTWCYDQALTKPLGDRITPDKIPVDAGDVLPLYAKWTPVEYAIIYNTYHGEAIPNGTYTIEQEVVLPMQVNRPGFTFAGWYADDMLSQKITKIEKGSHGDKTVYATWDRGYQLLIAQPMEGLIKVSRNGEEVAAGEMVGVGEQLVVSAEASTSGYTLKRLTIDGMDYTTSPQTIVMPKKDLLISAQFSTSTLSSVSAPEIITDPEVTDQVMYGTKVKVSIHKTDESSSLFYALNDEMARPYQGEFLVDGKQSDTIVVRAYARKDGFSDGITTREIRFDGRVAIAFELPKGITAINPGGGEVESAIIKGHTFKFRLEIDKAYFESLDSLKVWGNDELIVPGPTGIFSLDKVMKDVTIKVSGYQPKEHTVTLVPSANGSLIFTEFEGETTKKVAHGNEVSIEAIADLDYKFVEWSDGNQMNPRMLLVTKDTALSAKLIPDYKAYAMILPEIEGVRVKPFSGYSTEVRKGDTFKFYLSIAKGYHEENVRVKANGIVLEKNKGGYAIYKVDRNTRISVEGIVKDSYVLKLTDHVTAIDLKSLKDATTQKLYDNDWLLLQAQPIAGKVFHKWNDGKKDNPRLVTAIDAAHLIPLYEATENKADVKVTLRQSVGAAVTMLDSNVDWVRKGDNLQLKVVLLPAYSKSKVVLMANNKEIKPDATLRSSADMRTLIYTLTNIQEDTEVRLSGITLNVYKITTHQNQGGSVSASATSAKHGEKIHLAATPSAGNLFVRWWNGNTVDPYEFTVTADTEVKASFMGVTSLVSNEEIKDFPFRIYASNSLLNIELNQPAILQIWDVKGNLIKRQLLDVGIYSYPLVAGVYLVQVGNHQSVKVFVR